MKIPVINFYVGKRLCYLDKGKLIEVEITDYTEPNENDDEYVVWYHHEHGIGFVFKRTLEELSLNFVDFENRNVDYE